MKSQVLLAMFSLLAHQVDAFKLFETPLGDPTGGSGGLDWGKGTALRWRQGRAGPDGDILGTVRKLCQKCTELREKGFGD
jgi:hypothetical protein